MSLNNNLVKKLDVKTISKHSVNHSKLSEV